MDALFQAHQREPPLVDRSELHLDRGGERETYFNLPAWQPGVAMGTKVVTILPGNTRRDLPLPAVQSCFVLCDGRTGAPLAVMDGTALTYRKTAADSALASRFLSRSDACVLLMVGAGGLAPFLIDAHRAARPSIDKVLVWNRDLAKAQRLAAQIGAAVVTDLKTAVCNADIVSCATAATAPLIKGEWLKLGAHLDLVGSFTPDMRESDDEAVRRARLFVDSRWFAIDQPGDLSNPLSRGVITRAHIEADLYDLCRSGIPQPRRSQDITLYKNGGGGHLDLFTALFIWEAATDG
jgi:ornithine cyclodeaminase